MTAMRVIIMPEAQKDLRRITRALQTRLVDKLEWISDNASLLTHQPLRGESWPGCFKYRIGDYRIIYQIEWPADELIVLKVGHRREIYK